MFKCIGLVVVGLQTSAENHVKFMRIKILVRMDIQVDFGQLIFIQWYGWELRMVCIKEGFLIKSNNYRCILSFSLSLSFIDSSPLFLSDCAQICQWTDLKNDLAVALIAVSVMHFTTSIKTSSRILLRICGLWHSWKASFHLSLYLFLP